MQNVHKELSELKDQILTTDTINDKEIPVANLINDIDLILGNPGEFPFAQTTFVEKLEESLAQFSASHPKLMKQVRVVVNSLNEVGI